jgi:hypothetical protein
MPPYLPDLALEDVSAALDRCFPGVTGDVSLLGRGCGLPHPCHAGHVDYRRNSRLP